MHTSWFLKYSTWESPSKMSRLVYVKFFEETNLVLFNLCAHLRMANSQSFKLKLEVELKLEKLSQKKTHSSIS
jgi:hypothetical protein